MNKKTFEISVGFFMIIGILFLFILAFKASNLSQYSKNNTYKIIAIFDDIGDLKVRAPVTVAGVRVGEVSKIELDKKTFKAKVILLINKKNNIFSSDTGAKILTAGLIGGSYISLIPGYEIEIMKNGSEIKETQPAIILENLIGQFIYNTKENK